MRRAAAGMAIWLALAIATAGCGAPRRAASAKVDTSGAKPAKAVAARQPAVKAVDDRGAIPFVDTPGRMFAGVAVPGRPPPATNARPCAAADLTVTPLSESGGGSLMYQGYVFHNASATTCILRGFPKVVATSPGRPDVVATDANFFPGPTTPANMAPGGATQLNLETSTVCSAFPGGSRTIVPYTTVVVSIPGGGQLTLNGKLELICGLSTGAFYVPQPPQHYTQSPLTGATAKLDLPSSVSAGTTLHYLVELTNPTDQAMVLDPCPSYSQGIGRAGKGFLQLNCTTVHKLAAHHTVRYAMQIAILPDTPTGPTQVYWSIAAVGAVPAKGSLVVEPS